MKAIGAIAAAMCILQAAPGSAATVTYERGGFCWSSCKFLGIMDGTPVKYSMTFDNSSFTPYGDLTQSAILDFKFSAGSFVFEKSEAKAFSISSGQWQEKGQMPFFYLFASENIGSNGKYANIVNLAYEPRGPWGGYLGTGYCTTADCSSAISTKASLVSNVPLPPSVMLMLAGLAGFAALGLRGRTAIAA